MCILTKTDASQSVSFVEVALDFPIAFVVQGFRLLRTVEKFPELCRGHLLKAWTLFGQLHRSFVSINRSESPAKNDLWSK